jgi:hypothetical protein
LHSAGPLANLQIAPTEPTPPTLSTVQTLPGLVAGSPQRAALTLAGMGENGRYTLTAAHPDGALCGWMRPVTTSCTLAPFTVAGAPLPAGATNFGDRIALRGVEIADTQLTPGGQLPLTLEWQALADITDDYTVTVQVLDANDRLVGQVDSWPVQGTFRTSQWTPGETIRDPFLVQLDPELPPGQYRLLVGLYRLADLRRLPVLDENGAAVDDKFILPGLVVRG